MALAESNPQIPFPREKTLKPFESNKPAEALHLFKEQNMYLADIKAEMNKPLKYSPNTKYDEGSRPLGSQNHSLGFSRVSHSINAGKQSPEIQRQNGYESSLHVNHVQHNSELRLTSISPKSLSVNGRETCQTRCYPKPLSGADAINNSQDTNRTENAVTPPPNKQEQPEVNFPSHDMEGIYDGHAQYVQEDNVRSQARMPLLIKGSCVEGTFRSVPRRRRRRRHSDSDVLAVDDPTILSSLDVKPRVKLLRLSADSAVPRDSEQLDAAHQPSRVSTNYLDIIEMRDRMQNNERSRNESENVRQLLDSYGEVKGESEVAHDMTGTGMADDRRNTQTRCTNGKSRVKSGMDKICCMVCRGPANGTFFGAVVCLPCKSFFIRCTKEGDPCFLQRCRGDCEIQSKLRNRCQFCRFKRCIAAGMSRKEKPESIKPVDGHELCKVCGDLANGIHFGVSTCEGCKKFFRRSVKEYETYICKENKDCCLNPRNRNVCRYCRYQKCVRVGMSRTAIKMGRPRRISPMKIGDEVQTSANQVLQEGSQNVTCHVFRMNLTTDQEQSSSHFNSSHFNVDGSQDYNQTVTSTQNQRLQLPQQRERLYHAQNTQFARPEKRSHFAMESSSPPISPSHAIQGKGGINYNYAFGASKTNRNLSYEQKTEKNLYSMSSNANTSQDHTVLRQLLFYQCPKKHIDQSPRLMSSSHSDRYPTIASSHNSVPCNNILNEPTDLRTNGIFCAHPVCDKTCKTCFEHSSHPLSSKPVGADSYQMFENKTCDVITERMSLQKHYDCASKHMSFHSDGKVSYYNPHDHTISDQSCDSERPEALDLRVVCASSFHNTVEKKTHSDHESTFETQTSATEHNLGFDKKNEGMPSYTGAKPWDGKCKVNSLPVAYAVHGNSITQLPYLPIDNFVTDCNTNRRSPNVALYAKCELPEEVKLESNSKSAENNIQSGVGQHQYWESQHATLGSLQGIYQDNSNYKGDSVESLLVAKQLCQDREQCGTDNFGLNVNFPGDGSQLSSNYQDSQDSCEKFKQGLDQDVALYSSSPVESPYSCLPRLISKTIPKTRDRELRVLKIRNTENKSDNRCSVDDMKSTANDMTKSCDLHSEEYSFRLVNKIFMAYDTMYDLVNTSSQKFHSSHNGSVADSNAELEVFNGAMMKDFCYSPAKINQRWKQIKGCEGPLKDVLSQAEYNLILDIVRDYEQKIFLCDEVANEPAFTTTVEDCWPSSGKDKYHWTCLQERIVRQTFAETHFFHKVADKLQVKDRGRLEDHSKFLGNTILMASCEWFDPVRKKFHFFWNWKLPQDHPLNPFYQRITRLGSFIYNLHMHRTEITLLSILNLFLPGTVEVEEAPHMAEKSQLILQLLSHYLCSMNIDPNERIPELLEIMPKVNHMSVWYSNLIKNMKTDPNTMDKTLKNLNKLASNILAKRESPESPIKSFD